MGAGAILSGFWGFDDLNSVPPPKEVVTKRGATVDKEFQVW